MSTQSTINTFFSQNNMPYIVTIGDEEPIYGEQKVSIVVNNSYRFYDYNDSISIIKHIILHHKFLNCIECENMTDDEYGTYYTEHFNKLMITI